MGPNGGGKGKCSPTRVKNCLRTFLAHLFSHIGLCILVVGYAIVGAAIFERLESGFEIEQRDNKQRNWTDTFKQIRRDYVSGLWNITEQYNVLYEKNWTSRVEEELQKFEDTVVNYTVEQRLIYEGINREELRWSFSGALLYSVSIITTIGYGNIAPRTAWGKVLTMFYAVIGVPLMLLWLSNIGTLMANTFKFAYTHICCPNKSPRSRSVHKRSSLKQEPSSIQVKYSVSAMTCETHVVPEQFLPDQITEKPRAMIRRREQRNSLKGLDPAAKQMLRECAEYNVNMSQDERSRMVLQQLQAEMGGMAGIEEELDEEDAIANLPALILPPPLEGEIEDYSGSVSLNGGGGGPSLNGSRTNESQLEGTPSRVPLLHHSRVEGPDVVDVETLEDYSGGSLELTGGSIKERCDSPPVTGDRVPISLVLVFVVVYIMVGATVFSVWEDWNFLESAYFCFITLSTIGLGDYVPGKSFKNSGTEEGHAQLIVCCLYLVLGLAIIAMSFNLVQEEVAAKVKDIARHIGIIKDTPCNR